MGWGWCRWGGQVKGRKIEDSVKCVCKRCVMYVCERLCECL